MRYARLITSTNTVCAQTFHVSNGDYLLSMGVSQVLGSLLMGDLTSLSELVSEGKSGSFFYFSYDQRYMVKTISSAEARTLRRSLQDYHAHVKKFQVRVRGGSRLLWRLL